MLQKAFFQALDRPGAAPMRVQFNPTDLTFTKGAQFAEIAIPGLDGPALQFVRGAAETLTLELFFDSTDEGTGDRATSVTEQLDQFYELVKQDRHLHAPPKCLFSWGPAPPGGSSDAAVPSHAPFQFVGVVESVERKFVLFSPHGVPLRARATVRMKEYRTVEEMATPLQSADLTKARVVKRRERLDQIAAEEYADPAEWRRVAQENGVDDPRLVQPGRVLRIPPLRVESITKGGQ